MAVAEQIHRIEIKMVEIPHDEVVLTLSKEEAQFILNYLGQTVTGNMDSLRAYSYSVCEALRVVGVDYNCDFRDHIEGGIHYNRFKGTQGGY